MGSKRAKNTQFEIPEDFFQFDEERSDRWPDHPEVRRAVEWLRGRLPSGEWRQRRLLAAQRLYDLVINGAEPGTAGRLFDTRDTFAWHLFLAESYVDHIWNYDPIFGSRVVPIFASIGRNLDLLLSVDGIDARIDRMVGPERAQPNGPFFELLVAAAYRRAGAKVAFVPEKRGRARSHDMDVMLRGTEYAVECKRMETSEFGDTERSRMRAMWGPSAAYLASILRSTIAQVEFMVPIEEVPDDYLTQRMKAWRAAPSKPFTWADNVGRGRIGELDLAPLQNVLRDQVILAGSTRLMALLTGRYKRHQPMISSIRVKPADNPRYIKECDYATLLEWTPLAEGSISGRARDVLRKVADADRQLPSDKPGIVHVGVEAVEGVAVERLRHARIVASMRDFDPGNTPLEYVYTHFFAPESPPDESWAFDETIDVRSIRASRLPPLARPFLVLEPGARQRLGGHWQ